MILVILSSSSFLSTMGERMHSHVVFSAWYTFFSSLSSGDMPPRFQLWLMSEENSSADSSSFWLDNIPVRWYFWSWFWRRWTHDQDLYLVTHFSLESEMMYRWPYTEYWTAIPVAPYSQVHPSSVTPSSRELEMIQWCPETADWVAVLAAPNSQWRPSQVKTVLPDL